MSKDTLQIFAGDNKCTLRGSDYRQNNANDRIDTHAALTPNETAVVVAMDKVDSAVAVAGAGAGVAAAAALAPFLY